MANIRSPVWCISRIPILKWLQMICSVVVLLFIRDGSYQWFAYKIIILLCILLIILTFFTAVVLYLNIRKLYIVELIFNLIAFLLCFLASTVLTYDLIRMVSNSFSHHRYNPPTSIGRESWKNRIAVCTVFLLLDTLCYLASFVFTKHTNSYPNQ